MVRGESPDDLVEMPMVELPERGVCLGVMGTLGEM